MKAADIRVLVIEAYGTAGLSLFRISYQYVNQQNDAISQPKMAIPEWWPTRCQMV